MRRKPGTKGTSAPASGTLSAISGTPGAFDTGSAPVVPVDVVGAGDEGDEVVVVPEPVAGGLPAPVPPTFELLELLELLLDCDWVCEVASTLDVELLELVLVVDGSVVVELLLESDDVLSELLLSVLLELLLESDEELSLLLLLESEVVLLESVDEVSVSWVEVDVEVEVVVVSVDVEVDVEVVDEVELQSIQKVLCFEG